MVAATLLPTLHAQEPSDPAWRQFQHALGAAAPIGVNASHSLAASVVRPFPPVDLQDVNPRKYLLGSDLYNERALSADNSIGCFICHAGRSAAPTAALSHGAWRMRSARSTP